VTTTPSDEGSPADRTVVTAGERLICLVPEQGLIGRVEDEMTLHDLWTILWSGKWIIVVVTSLFAIGSVTYALLAEEWYRAEVLLAPVEENSTLSLGQFGGLASLAGVKMGGGGSVEAVATLRSREFARDFIDDFSLLTVLFADDWNAETGQWLIDDPKDWPDVRDAVRYFHESVLGVSENFDTGLVTIGIEWKSPTLAAEWANVLARRLNVRLRERALQEAESNVAYLQEELARTGVVTTQQTISRLLESELQKLMLARGNEEFAFRVIDAAEIPKKRVRPKRALIAVLGTIVGGMLSVFWVLLSSMARSRSKPL